MTIITKPNLDGHNQQKDNKKLSNHIKKWKGTVTLLDFDHPWDFGQKGKLGAEKHYNLMTPEQILGMAPAVKYLSADNAHCYIWVINQTIEFGHTVMRAYGFTPRNLLFWPKPRITLGN